MLKCKCSILFPESSSIFDCNTTFTRKVTFLMGTWQGSMWTFVEQTAHKDKCVRTTQQKQLWIYGLFVSGAQCQCSREQKVLAIRTQHRKISRIRMNERREKKPFRVHEAFVSASVKTLSLPHFGEKLRGPSTFLSSSSHSIMSLLREEAKMFWLFYLTAARDKHNRWLCTQRFPWVSGGGKQKNKNDLCKHVRGEFKSVSLPKH